MEKVITTFMMCVLFTAIYVGVKGLNKLNDGRVQTVVSQLVKWGIILWEMLYMLGEYVRISLNDSWR
jgi:uncharacterized protein with GYD domain